MNITTITPVKIFKTEDGPSRSIERIEQQLASLREQKTRANISPIISDCSDELEFRRGLKRACKKYGARYIHTETDLVWNKPLILNRGIKSSSQKSKYIVSLDADIILRDDVIERCLEVKTERNVIVCQTYMYKESSYDFDDFSEKNFNKCRPHGRFLNLSGNGGLQFFDRKWIFTARGYDERYSLWGGIDNEIIKRAKRAKLKDVWLNEINKEILLLHLNHPKHLVPGISRDFISKYKKEYNVKYYKSRGNMWIANSRSWGDEKNIVGPRFIDGEVVIK